MKNLNLNNSSLTGSKGGQAKTMADLMQSVKTAFKTFRKGETVEGVITKLDENEILVDVNAKTEAVVMENDKRNMQNLLANLQAGDKVEVSVLNPESDMGYPVVSLRRFLDTIMWRKMEGLQKNSETIEVTVTDTTRGGYLVTSKTNMNGFLPNSHTLDAQKNPQDMIGRKIRAYVLELNRPERKIVFSQKQVWGTKEFEDAVKSFNIEQKIKATVSHITSFGIFVNVSVPGKENQTLDGLIHISEISWEQPAELQEIFHVGDIVECIVIGFDKDAKRIDLSIKRLSADPFGQIVQALPVDQKIKGIVRRTNSAAVFIEFTHQDKQLEGIIRKEKIPPNTTYAVGQSIQATISQIDKHKRRILLTPILTEKPIGYR